MHLATDLDAILDAPGGLISRKKGPEMDQSVRPCQPLEMQLKLGMNADVIKSTQVIRAMKQQLQERCFESSKMDSNGP